MKQNEIQHLDDLIIDEKNIKNVARKYQSQGGFIIRVCKTVYTCGLSAIFFYLHDNRHDLITCRDINGASKYRSGAC